MAKTAFLNMRLHEGLKTEAEAVYADLGLTLREAVTIFLRQSIKAGGFPFAMRTREENAAALDTLDFTEERDAAEERPAFVAEKEMIKEAKKTVSPAPAKKAARVFTAEEIEKYKNILDTLTAGTSGGGAVRLSYKRLAAAGIPEEFLRQYWNMTPQHMLSVEVTEEELLSGGMETAENGAHEERTPTPASLEMQGMIDRIVGILESFGVPISLAGQRDDETLEQFALRFRAAIEASLVKLPRGKRRQVQRAIGKEMDHTQARLTQKDGA